MQDQWIEAEIPAEAGLLSEARQATIARVRLHGASLQRIRTHVYRGRSANRSSRRASCLADKPCALCCVMRLDAHERRASPGMSAVWREMIHWYYRATWSVSQVALHYLYRTWPHQICDAVHFTLNAVLAAMFHKSSDDLAVLHRGPRYPELRRHGRSPRASYTGLEASACGHGYHGWRASLCAALLRQCNPGRPWIRPSNEQKQFSDALGETRLS